MLPAPARALFRGMQVKNEASRAMKAPAGAHLHLLLPTLQLQGEEHGRDPRPNKSPGQFVGILLKPSSEGRLPIRGQEQPDVLLVMRPQP